MLLLHKKITCVGARVYQALVEVTPVPTFTYSCLGLALSLNNDFRPIRPSLPADVTLRSYPSLYPKVLEAASTEVQEVLELGVHCAPVTPALVTAVFGRHPVGLAQAEHRCCSCAWGDGRHDLSNFWIQVLSLLPSIYSPACIIS